MTAPVITRTAIEPPDDPDGLTIRWGHDMSTGALQLGIWYRGRCVQVGFEEADRDLSAAAFYHQFIHPALRALEAV
jgi:hypothetical protein